MERCVKLTGGDATNTGSNNYFSCKLPPGCLQFLNWNLTESIRSQNIFIGNIALLNKLWSNRHVIVVFFHCGQFNFFWTYASNTLLGVQNNVTDAMLYFVFGGLGHNINYIIQLLITLGKFCKSQWIHPKPCFHWLAVWYFNQIYKEQKKL